MGHRNSRSFDHITIFEKGLIMSSMVMDLPTNEEFNSGGGNFMRDEAGKYHMVVIHAEENAMRGEKMVKGFMLELSVQAPAEHATKTFKMYFQNPDPSFKDGGAFALKKQVAALIAANVIAPSDLGKKGLQIDISKAANQQLLVNLELGKPSQTDGKRYLDLAFSDIYHVDDPRAKSYPREKDLLELIPAEVRREEAFFAPLLTQSKKAPVQRVDDADFDGL